MYKYNLPMADDLIINWSDKQSLAWIVVVHMTWLQHYEYSDAVQ